MDVNIDINILMVIYLTNHKLTGMGRQLNKPLMSCESLIFLRGLFFFMLPRQVHSQKCSEILPARGKWLRPTHITTVFAIYMRYINKVLGLKCL